MLPAPVRNLLRQSLKATAAFLPKTPTLKQIRVDGRPTVVWLNEHIGRRLYFSRRFEAAETRLFAEMTRPGDVVLDIGANIGLHAITFATAAGRAGRVFAFEPFRRNALLVALNAELNDVTVEVVEAALSDADGGSLSATVPGNDSAYAYFVEATTSSPGMVRRLRLDTWINEQRIRRVDVVKIDVEGAEMRILTGAASLLTTLRPRVFFVELCAEFLERFGDRPEAVFALFEAASYRPFHMTEAGLRPFEKLVGSMNIAFTREGAEVG